MMMKMMTNLISNNRKNNLEVLGHLKTIRRIIMTITTNINKTMITRETLNKMHINILSRPNKITQNQLNNQKDQRNSLKESFSMNSSILLVSKAERKRSNSMLKELFQLWGLILKIKIHMNRIVTKEVNKVLRN
jgi:hypothetical protein